MLAPVGVLTALAAIGGLLHVSGLWDASGEWLNDAVEPLVEPSTVQDYEASFVAALLGSLGMYLAWTRVRHGKELVTRPDARRLLERKLYFDELYDTIFYRPAVALARGAFRHVETPLIERPLDELGSAALDAGGGVARVQTGLVRTYALAVALAVAVLVVVFVAVR
jgi:NADH:ubiquinone oxidoreductase subunit 5 (subunit L)/multisubunit Na+/H+ antiporter MnhA subunit